MWCGVVWCVQLNRGRGSEEDVQLIMKQLFTALVVCHKFNVAHCDIKPEHLCYATRESGAALRLVNFENACVAEDDAVVKEFSIDLRYVAPEVLSNEKRTGKSWRASDVYAPPSCLCGAASPLIA